MTDFNNVLNIYKTDQLNVAKAVACVTCCWTFQINTFDNIKSYIKTFLNIKTMREAENFIWCRNA